MDWNYTFLRIKEFSTDIIRDYIVRLFCKKDKYERCVRDLVSRTTPKEELVGVGRIDLVETVDSFAIVLVREGSTVIDTKQQVITE